MTGFSNYDPAMVGKWLELLKQIAPNTKKVAVLYNPDSAPHSIFLPPLKDAMQAFAMQMVTTLVRSVGETIASGGAEVRTACCSGISSPFSVVLRLRDRSDRMRSLTANRTFGQRWKFRG